MSFLTTETTEEESEWSTDDFTSISSDASTSTSQESNTLDSYALLYLQKERVQLIEDYDRALYDVVWAWLKAFEDANDWTFYAHEADKELRVLKARYDGYLKMFDATINSESYGFVKELSNDLYAISHTLHQYAEKAADNEVMIAVLEIEEETQRMNDLLKACEWDRVEDALKHSGFEGAPMPDEVMEILEKYKEVKLLKLNPTNRQREARINRTQNLREKQSVGGAIQKGLSVSLQKKQWEEMDKKLNKNDRPVKKIRLKRSASVPSTIYL